MKRIVCFSVLSLAFIILLSGCATSPDSLYQKGKYSEAYVEFVKRGGLNETALKTEVANGSFDPRNKAGNQAIHDYYYAAESQKKLGNEAEAKGFYKRVVDLSQYQVRIPQDKAAKLKKAFDGFNDSVRDFRTQEVFLTGDPDLSDLLYRLNYGTMQTKRREFEKLLYSTTPDEVPDVEKLKTEYEKMSKSLDGYLTFAAPGGLLSSPNSLATLIYYVNFEKDSDKFRKSLYASQGNIRYDNESIKLTEPQLVEAAKVSLGSEVNNDSSPQSPTEKANPSSTSGTAPDKTDSF